ncbi:hypothetical protein SEA_LEONARD_55 [Gordonia phage Leonard]|uniref:Uncharacterized protein n=1 Tax=Gordonia phage Leonard TaxID=2656539 RepID=A0A649VM06_9CAUD|nr:hypothetical protein BI045_gp55 [Gordonia phage Phinally]YP_010002274.1 hypothetical protein J1769_gp55 [Gordonia phage Leonard]AMS03047.1 hypothetical protein SEA_PHINALLY_55 [Gordonia phage Phinally]QGJ93417.1 hypothetical protein SEA_LEONARD_55 [Gordonia phage Leonard]
MNWRAAVVAAAIVVACISALLLVGSGRLDDEVQAGRGVFVFGLLLTASVAVAAGVGFGA